MKIHKNLGHPSNDRLARTLQASQQRPELVRAAMELPCAACAANRPPSHQRPGRLKPLLDFNHRIYVDGIQWHNHQNQGFHLYHALDAGTNFHVAFIAPAQSTQDIIGLLRQHWFCWAGIPAEMTMDSGTELNSEEFSNFTNAYGIKCTTTCPEAHWQIGKVERHGAFLQDMLSRIDSDMPITTYTKLQAALNQCTQAKNSMSVRHGYSPR